MEYTKIEGKSTGYYGLIALFGILAILGIYEFFLTLQAGQGDLGVSNRVPWGITIIMVEFLKGASVGLLLLSTLGYVFGKDEFKPVSRISAYLAIILLLVAMATIVGELGKPMRFINVFAYGLGNLDSIFAINAFLYSGYILVSAAYLWSIFSEKLQLAKIFGILAIALAAAVITASGATFGFISARELWFSPILPLLSIAAALVSGVSLLILMIAATSRLAQKPLDEKIVTRLGKFLLTFLLIFAFIVLIEILTKVYPFGGEEEIKFLLNGPYSSTFWIGLILIGIVLPVGILIAAGKSLYNVAAASLLSLVGAFSEKFGLIIAGQDMTQFQVVERAVMGLEGEAALYSVSAAEFAIILGAIGAIGILYIIGLRTIKLLPSH